jgi:hypothetical protein
MKRKKKEKNQWKWDVPIELTEHEKWIIKQTKRVGKLFEFLRKQRHELFDEKFQEELAQMYSDAPRGTLPLPPAMLAMVTLLQAYTQTSDAAAVQCAMLDLRWQMVLGCLGVTTPPFSQGVLVDFRRRLIEHDMDRRLLQRTVELARKTGDFGHKQLRVALDSSPLWGAGRVEDTFNLLGHALEVLVKCAAQVKGCTAKTVRHQAGLKLLGGSSLKASLDVDWDDPDQQHKALQQLLMEVQRLKGWIDKKLANQVDQPPLREALALVEKVIAQDLEPDPGGGMKIKRGVAKDRQISVTDPEMRHGRKSRRRVFNGYKRHIVRELDLGLILSAVARPANEPERMCAEQMRNEVEYFGEVAELHIDRAYLSSDWARRQFDAGKPLLAKPWPIRNANRFPKTAFKINLTAGTVRCPENQIAPIRNGKHARFNGQVCDACPSRSRCTKAASGKGRTITIHPQEAMMIKLREAKSTSAGRNALRQRTSVEHGLAHVGQRQGPRARYKGIRKNTLDLRRTAAVVNLHAVDRVRRAA